MNNRFASNSDIHKFAVYWLDIFQNSTEEYDTFSMQDQMVDLGFKMDCGKAFEAAYGLMAFQHSNELKRIIDNVTDVQVLCSGILSVYRGITHWWQESVLDDENRAWFKIALARLVELTNN